MSDARQVIAELTRVKVLFQARALAAAMGLPAPPTPTLPARLTEGEVA